MKTVVVLLFIYLTILSENLYCLEKLPPETNQPILVQMVISSKNVKDAGRRLRRLMLASKGSKKLVDENTRYLIDKRAKIYETPAIVTAAYFGTKGAREYFEEMYKQANVEKKLSMLRYVGSLTRCSSKPGSTELNIGKTQKKVITLLAKDSRLFDTQSLKTAFPRNRIILATQFIRRIKVPCGGIHKYPLYLIEIQKNARDFGICCFRGDMVRILYCAKEDMREGILLCIVKNSENNRIQMCAHDVEKLFIP